MPTAVFKYALTLVWFGLLLSACARAPTSVEAPAASWEQRYRALTALNYWEISGRIAIIGADDNVNASLHWRQQGERFMIRLSGPFGQGGVQLHNDGQKVILSDGRQVISAPDTGTLLQKLGLTLPLTGLRYWLRGLPQPGPVAKMVQDSQARLSNLQQAGWDIRYLRYKELRGLALPSKIFLQGHGYKVRVLVHQWQLPQNGLLSGGVPGERE